MLRINKQSELLIKSIKYGKKKIHFIDVMNSKKQPTCQVEGLLNELKS